MYAIRSYYGIIDDVLRSLVGFLCDMFVYCIPEYFRIINDHARASEVCVSYNFV